MIPGFGRGFFYLLRYHTTAGPSPGASTVSHLTPHFSTRKAAPPT